MRRFARGLPRSRRCLLPIHQPFLTMKRPFSDSAPMKSTKRLLIRSLICAALVTEICCDQQQNAKNAKPPSVNVLEMKSVPDGHFLINLQLDGQERLLNIVVRDNVAKCVKASEARLKGLQGKFQLIQNGVFRIFFQGENYRASQVWIFRKDGSAAIREVPDRGEQQTAVPVDADTLELPKRVQ